MAAALNKHLCHWPGCDIEVPPKLWGCTRHWFKLPKELRDKIWATYREGQEIDKGPSREYLDVADEVERWCLNYIKKKEAHNYTGQLPF